MTTGHEDIRIGTLVPADGAVSTIRQIMGHGFESFQLTFGHWIGDVDLDRIAGDLLDLFSAAQTPPVISALGLYGNPLIDEQTAGDWARLIDAAERFECNVVGGFSGRLPDVPVPDSLPKFREVFTPLAAQAEQRDVKIALENCDMHGDWQRGDWNIAHAPTAWEMIFDAVPSDALGLEWEPCHQMVSLIDPLTQLKQWVGKVFHIHGKDATIQWDVIRRCGIRSGVSYVDHRTPGFGDTNWTDLISILRMNGYRGAIDIEGWHDPVYCDDLEMTGQVHALNHLKQCRGGPFVRNPQ